MIIHTNFEISSGIIEMRGPEAPASSGSYVTGKLVNVLATRKKSFLPN
jgi:hypothetical protein